MTLPVVKPPSTSTFPFGNKVATCCWRLVFMEPVGEQFPVAGLYNSHLARLLAPLLVAPPASSTLPLGNSVAVCNSRAVAMAPVTLFVPASGVGGGYMLIAGS